MVAKHTPGPWEAVDSMTIRGPFERSNPEKPGFFVASLPASRAEGDAQLIASAPELLKALIDLLPVADLAYTIHTESGETITHPAITAAREAIAKAVKS